MLDLFSRRTRRACVTVLACLLGSSACGERGHDQPQAAPSNEDLQGAERLVGRVLDASEDLAMPGDLALVGDHLVLINNRADSVIRVYRAETGEHLLSFGREGRGPGEFDGAWSIDPVPRSGSGFWVYDIALQRLTGVDLATDFGAARSYREKIVSVRGGGPPTGPVWVTDSLFLSPGYFQEPGRIAHFAASGQMLRVVGEPPPGDPETPLPVRQHAYQSSARPNPARTLIAVATRHADRLDIYRPDGTLAASAARPRGFEPVYEVVRAGGAPTMATGDELRFGYIDLATTDRYIYALYSGLRRADAPGRANYGRVIRVYDWNARLVRTLALDLPVLNIAADPTDRRLYAARIDPSPALVAFDLGSASR